MSYKSLLFCPDEKTARAVTQVLSELDFTVETASEPFAAVKRLTDEQFDAVVVDSANEQDASLLFKAARNSAHNHSSLSVAVVEGQAGVAKAFRIGANLVLTKPINIEQSKSTLRVARGLLRKNQQKPAGTVAAPVESGVAAASAANESASIAAAKPWFQAQPSGSALTPVMSGQKPESPTASSFSVLETEHEPDAITEASDAAVLESLPELPEERSHHQASISESASQPIAASTIRTGGAAAAAAPALEKKPELKIISTAPMFTNEPITREHSKTDPPVAEPVAAPTFSSLETTSAAESGGGKKFLAIVAVLLVVAVGGFFGWQKLHNRATPDAAAVSDDAQQPTTSSSASTPSQEVIQASPAATPASAGPEKKNNVAPTTSAKSNEETDSNLALLNAVPAHSKAPSPDSIEIQEMPFSKDSKPTASAKPQPTPLVVKTGGETAKVQPSSTPLAPPQVQIANNSAQPLPNLVSTGTVLPKTAPMTTVQVSQGVSQGLLLKKVPPVYPRMALQMQKGGTVQLMATISKTGDINHVKVLSGDNVLAQAAVDAVMRWKYRPYLLNGEPVEIETQISVNFKAPR
jgi:periplasmic protein TonB